MPIPYALGALPSPADPRDYQVAAFLPPTAPVLPPELDFRPCLQPIRNQGSEAACVGFALASGVMGYDEQTGQHLDRILSPRDVYEQARTLSPVPGGAGGSYPRAALEAARTVGVCLESDRPYLPGSPSTPGPNAAANRALNQLASYAAVGRSVSEIKTALFYHGPLLTGLTVDDGFCYPKSGIISPGGTRHGGHGVAIVGWRDDLQAWLIRNSWDVTWGVDGYAYLPWSEDGDQIYEVWASTGALKDGKPVIPDAPWWMRLFPWLHA